SLGESRGPARAIFRNAATILRHEAPGWPHRVEHPVLALSGGAANGAFTAGYLHALLSLREMAIQRSETLTPSPNYTHRTHGRHYGTLANLIDAEYRFGGAAGTSVGSLVSMLVDLYFAHPKGPLSEPILGALRHCVADAHRAGIGDGILPKNRAVQACALAKLRQDLSTRNEWDLLCAEPGDILELIINRPNMLRFDPLMRHIVRPYLETFHTLLAQNDFVTIAMSVDLQQNVLIGVDERVCQAASIPTVDCLAAGIQASISEPIFVPPVRRLHLGLKPTGQTGTWLDGGLHSGTPVARALGLAGDGVPILAINTNRAEGVPNGPLGDAFDALFGSLGTMADKTREWEIAYGELQDEERSRKLRALRRILFGKTSLKKHWRWSHRRRRWTAQEATSTSRPTIDLAGQPGLTTTPTTAPTTEPTKPP
ncbi:MAG: patatin-like phospholipase family protein, partial [Deltaproteobacteria bacterium]|nr:patatin-like phospholipase family protein [Deltaproteobacteria bacterium]